MISWIAGKLVDDAFRLFKEMRNERLKETLHEINGEARQLCELTGM